jgi:hypothetical protein
MNNEEAHPRFAGSLTSEVTRGDREEEDEREREEAWSYLWVLGAAQAKKEGLSRVSGGSSYSPRGIIQRQQGPATQREYRSTESSSQPDWSGKFGGST